MYLKKIELFGFKSFADKTEVVFEPGVTCVVGPNGCGKSNISDAVRWVLGERSAKLLRGTKMEDVIFAGTEFRKPLGLAEVSLTIDNQDKIMAIEYDEVVLTRRLYRSGESEYLINKTVCRLKDIQDLILDTGIGSNSYSMIEQGKIDYVLSADAEERRFLIEEAAGISKYKVKKEEALRKLERTEDNLLRLGDIVSEVEKNIKYAERQARRAEKYKKQFEELKRFEIINAFMELKELENKKEEIEHERNDLSSASTELENEIKTLEAEATSKDTEISDLEESLLNKEREKGTILQSLSRIQSSLEHSKEKIADWQDEKPLIFDEKRNLEQKIETTKSDIASRQEELSRFYSTKNELENQLKVKRANSEEINNEVAQKRIQLEECKTKTFDIASEEAGIQNELNEVNSRLMSIEGERKRVNEFISRMGDKLNRLDEEVTELDSELDKVREECSRFDGNLRSKEEALKILSTEREECVKAFNEKSARMKEIDATIKTLKQWEGQILAYRSGAAHILSDEIIHRDEFRGVRSFLSTFRIKEGFETAIKSALVDYLHDIVADDEFSAFNVIDYLKRENKGDVSILSKRPLSAPEVAHSDIKSLPGILGCALDFVEAERGYEDLLRSVLSHVLVVEKIDARNFDSLYSLLKDYILVSKDGVVLGPGLRFYGGSVDIEVVTSAIDSKKREAQLNEEKALLSDEVKALEEMQSSLNGRIKKSEEDLERERTFATETRVVTETKQQLLQNTKHEKNSISSEIDQSKLELEHSQSEEERLVQRKSELKEKLKLVHERNCEAKNFLELETKHIEDWNERKEKCSIELTKLEAEVNLAREREEHLLSSIEMMNSSLKSAMDSLTSKKRALAEGDGRVERLAAQNSRETSEIEELNNTIKNMDDQISVVRERRNQLSGERNERFQHINSKKENLANIKEKLHELNLKSVEMSYGANSIFERLQQTYKINLKEINKDEFLHGEVINTGTVKEQIEYLSKKVESIGTVNLLAIDEYNELKERYDFLQSQKCDLEQAREELLEAIRKINRTTKQLFEETFTQVGKLFDEHFKILFNGGFAQLKLVDESKPLESGIDIMVRPPGKKTQHISLLSGGEKALTAIALLFALFTVKPSPFCVLDEVDAPLDEANIERFLKVLETFLDRSQFIIITHNRKTIAMGDSLYGVTMQEPGISRIVSVKLKDESAKEDQPEASKTKSDKIDEVLEAVHL